MNDLEKLGEICNDFFKAIAPLLPETPVVDAKPEPDAPVVHEVAAGCDVFSGCVAGTRTFLIARGEAAPIVKPGDMMDVQEAMFSGESSSEGVTTGRYFRCAVVSVEPVFDTEMRIVHFDTAVVYRGVVSEWAVAK